MDPINASSTPPKKTERSHAENQERAYIAASRRADRSIEARVQSARMASEIHKKRTGKAFRITEEIVIKEEMYEEEEDDFPRSYRLLGPHMQTSSADMNSRVGTYLTSRVAMSKYMSATEQDWRDNAVNRAFAEMFPDANRHAQSLSHRWSTPGFPVPASQNGRLPNAQDQAFDPSFQPVSYEAGKTHNDRSRSFSGVSPTELGNDNHNHTSPPDLTPGTASHPDTPVSQPALGFGEFSPNNFMGYSSHESSFTSELPAEARMLMEGMDLSSSLAPGANPQDWMPSNEPMFAYADFNQPIKQEARQVGQGMDMHAGLFDNSLEHMDWDTAQPGNGEEPSWDTFLNDTAWTNDQQ
ncbi:hypothetical protein EDB81DRAFT_840834 [Dactylonectria macrodidyma]|uniref:Uncharacterized protein n=1 Tax=Dactylonectria macrodidyma TaxID=307937 RepID=A0A9P9FBA7_9HYPO|nr:hypothetical protein EDB81DRAFT_840834 [Dactylonectria macrodidyma]